MNKFITPGIPDEMFERGNVPMTKEEIRTVAISKLRLSDDSRIIDIGAGTGSVTIECAFIARNGLVYSVEKDVDALALIRKNTLKFKTGNVAIIEGEAPGVLDKTGSFDRAFIGGSGGNLSGILDFVHRNIDLNGRIVITAVTLDTLFEAGNFFRKMNYFHEIIQVAVTKVTETAGLSMMKSLNPVFIISAMKVNI